MAKAKKKRLSGVGAARAGVTAAKKAFKAGHKGSSERLDKAITRYAHVSCRSK